MSDLTLFLLSTVFKDLTLLGPPTKVLTDSRYEHLIIRAPVSKPDEKVLDCSVC